jgi:hypothetical protein
MTEFGEKVVGRKQPPKLVEIAPFGDYACGLLESQYIKLVRKSFLRS